MFGRLTLLLMSAGVVAAADQGFFSSLLAKIYDPTWNAENSLALWAVLLVVLLLSGVGLPLPEDVPLTIAGFTTTIQAGGELNLLHMGLAFVVLTVPILVGDLLAYSMGRRWGFSLRGRVGFLRRVLTDARMERVRGWFEHYGNFTVFLGRQLAGVRFVTFFTAGTMRMRLPAFIFFDFLGCLVSVPVWLTLGFLTARHGREWLDIVSRRVGGGFLIGGAVLAVALILFAKWRSSRRGTPSVDVSVTL